MENSLEEAIATLIKAIAAYIGAFALRKFVRDIQLAQGILEPEEWRSERNRDSGRPPPRS